MSEEQRTLIRKCAEAAREIAQEIRPHEEISGEAWVNADWLADTLTALDWQLACEALDEISPPAGGGSHTPGGPPPAPQKVAH